AACTPCAARVARSRYSCQRHGTAPLALPPPITDHGEVLGVVVVCLRIEVHQRAALAVLCRLDGHLYHDSFVDPGPCFRGRERHCSAPIVFDSQVLACVPPCTSTRASLAHPP